MLEKLKSILSNYQYILQEEDFYARYVIIIFIVVYMTMLVNVLFV